MAPPMTDKRKHTVTMVPASAHRSARGERTVVLVSYHTPPSKSVVAKVQHARREQQLHG